MLFNSLPFVFFFTVVTSVYFLIPHKFRWFLLLLASCFFYMFFKPEYILILAFTIAVDYCAGILIENQADSKKRKRYLVMSLIANIGVLAVFKYFNFFNANITGIALLLGYKNPIPFLSIALPIGLSFHTFQAISYTIEVYRGSQKAERHFGIYALYVMFYPQLVAGPIERPQNMLHQFHEQKYFNYNNAVTGLRLMLWGLFKKTVIADRLALFTDPVFNNPGSHSALTIMFAAIFFSFEAYCDFSGYSDIAIGSARFMGFKLMNNFNRPYSSKSVAEFWHRWHISLSTWFRDYLYIPMGGNRVSPPRRLLNLFIVFLVCGLWHGANWNYIVWGAVHGFYMVFAELTFKIRNQIKVGIGLNKLKKLDNTIQILITFSLVTIAQIFFRAPTVADAINMIRQLPFAIAEGVDILLAKTHMVQLPVSNARFFMCIVVIGVLEAVHIVQNRGGINALIQKQPRYIRWFAYYTFLFAVIYLGVFHNRQFIYFQF